MKTQVTLDFYIWSAELSPLCMQGITRDDFAFHGKSFQISLQFYFFQEVKFCSLCQFKDIYAYFSAKTS